MTISEAAKARGQIGFLHPKKEWKIVTRLRDGTTENTLTTSNKRSAHRRFDMIAKYGRDESGKYAGCTTRLLLDGELVREVGP